MGKKATNYSEIFDLDLFKEVNKPYSKQLIQKSYGYRFCICDDLRKKKEQKMDIYFNKEIEQFVNDKVNSGKYQSASEVSGEALRLLYERDRLQEARLAELKAKIKEGIEELDRGEGIDGEEVFAELVEDIRRIEATDKANRGS